MIPQKKEVCSEESEQYHPLKENYSQEKGVFQTTDVKMDLNIIQQTKAM